MMDFKSFYNKFSKLRTSCNIINQFEIDKIMFGQGGSQNIVIGVRDKNKNKLIIKVIPDFTFYNLKIKPNFNLLEIKFYKFFTQKYILTDRTPHFVGIYNHQKCNKIDKLLNNIKPNKKVCPTYVDLLTKKMKLTNVEKIFCDLLLRCQMKILGPIYDVALLEYCDGDLSIFIKEYMEKLNVSSGVTLHKIQNNFMCDIQRFLFQIIFTLAIVKEDYPGFLHGDLFIRNILFIKQNKYSDNDYVAYYYKQKIFYLPANGVYIKINDFGLTLIVNELVPNTYEIDKKFHKFQNKNPFDEKTDIFNILHDIYDGQNLGSESIMKMVNNLKMSDHKIGVIVKFIDKFINTKIINKINNTNGYLLDNTWYIDGIKNLENTVKTPNDYLVNKYFNIYQNLPNNANIIKHFNLPNQSFVK